MPHLYQKTLQNDITLNGIGVHNGLPVTLCLQPQEENTGIIFKRSEFDSNNIIYAKFDCVTDTMMSTTLTNQHGVSISTVEHLMAALSGFDITNCLIHVSGPEMPIMDGSALPFCDAILKAGIKKQFALRPVIEIIKPIIVENKNSWVKMEPSKSRIFSMSFDFYGKLCQELLPTKEYIFDLDHESFHDKLSHARTFGLYEDGEKLKKMGLAIGANLENTVVIKDQKILNKEGLRCKDELIQHKLLDAIGDLFLYPAYILGKYTACNGSHALNNQLMKALFHEESSWIEK